ncbi:hypothetical protein CLU79DRAFT_548999 [Phycomyces nitens]|nr:hypothetical protein CLU79DRAFT_548999 [Phycomyces nitens]
MSNQRERTLVPSNHRNPLTNQLLTLFPGGDPDYFEACLVYYDHNHVERIAEKICSNGGHYPSVPHDCLKNRVKQLNHSLRILAVELFPDCDVSYLRDKVLGYTHSHIEQVTEAIIQDRWPERLESGKINRWDFIKSESYRAQAQEQLSNDFPQIWRSSIRAVLAENNWDYLNTRDQLEEMGSGSIWRSIRNFFLHWSIRRSSRPVFEHGYTPELENELDELRIRHLRNQSEKDQKLAHQINQEQYSKHNQLITCLCCYDDFAFENLAFCSEGEHTFCHSCVNRFMSEGLFGQGSLRGMQRIQCISPTNCDGCLSPLILKQVLTPDVWMAYEKSVFEANLNQACLTMVQCPQCSYSEIDETVPPFSQILCRTAPLFRVARWLMVVMIVLSFYYTLSLVLPTLLTTLPWLVRQQWDLESDMRLVYDRIAQVRRGKAFKCRNPACAKLSCLVCMRSIRGLHNCTEQEQDGLRLYVEKAMADAVKRTCPVCNLSFQKEDGCNKVVCKCGYAMCYVCRKDIGKESYSHFCDHFRIIPGTQCTKCTRCDLYKTDPEDQAIQKAEEVARKEYLRAHPNVPQQSTGADIVIGPMTTLERMDAWRREKVLQTIQYGMDLCI